MVGISGTIAPMMPSPTQANPSASQPRRAARLTGLCRTGSRKAVIGQHPDMGKGIAGAVQHPRIVHLIQIERIDRSGKALPIFATPPGWPAR